VSEQTEEEYLIERLSKLLAEISVIVNGPQPMGVLWSYADLPQKVQALKDAAALNAQAGVMEALLREAFAHGNQRGHERTVEGYWSPEIDDDFSEWLQDTPAALAAVRGATP
jgi:hypothetical protein